MDRLSDAELSEVYAWVDTIPLSRPKRNIGRDFADCCLAAEIVAHYFPRMVELHNYSAQSSMRQKIYNWDTFNVRVLRKLGASLTKKQIEHICQCKPGAVELFLRSLQLRIMRYKSEKKITNEQKPTVLLPEEEIVSNQVDQELLIEKEQEIQDLRETVDILEQKVAKLEQLLRLKDAKIMQLQNRT